MSLRISFKLDQRRSQQINKIDVHFSAFPLPAKASGSTGRCRQAKLFRFDPAARSNRQNLSTLACLLITSVPSTSLVTMFSRASLVRPSACPPCLRPKRPPSLCLLMPTSRCLRSRRNSSCRNSTSQSEPFVAAPTPASAPCAPLEEPALALDETPLLTFLKPKGAGGRGTVRWYVKQKTRRK